MADQDAKQSDEAFMDIIREYPTIYDRASKDFKDKNKKSNCWKAVAERLDEPVDIVKQHYESIRTQFSKYLRARRGASGCGSDDIPLTSKFEHLRWLKTFIISRASSTNLRRMSKQPTSQISSQAQSHLVDALSDELDDQSLEDDEGDRNNIMESYEHEEEMSQSQAPNTDLQTSASVSDNEPESTTESIQPVSAATPKAGTAASSKKVWVKKESRKRQLEKNQ